MRERMSLLRFGPLAVFLAVASMVGARGPGGSFLATVIARSALGWLLVLQFRIRDDLAALPYDREHFPERVLCRADNLRPFWRVVVGLTLVNALLAGIGNGIFGVILFGVLTASFDLVYRVAGAPAASAGWSHPWVLLKYPVFVLLVSGPDQWTTWLGMWPVLMLVFITFCIFEMLDTGAIHALRGADVVLRLELLVQAVSFLVVLEAHASVGALNLGWASALLAVWFIVAVVFLTGRHSGSDSMIRLHRRMAPIALGVCFGFLVFVITHQGSGIPT